MATNINQSGEVEHVIVHDVDQVQRWSMRDPIQAEKMLPTFQGLNVGKIAAGDASAIRDAANEFRKQIES